MASRSPSASERPARTWALSARVLTLLPLALLLGGCPGDPPYEGDPEEELTEFQLEHGIGPIHEPYDPPAEVDSERAAEGARIFQVNCQACHRMDDDFVGPALGDVLERRTPTFVLNMILNPEEMGRRHPVGRELRGQYPSAMPYQGIDEDEARALLEYLREEGG